MRTVIVTACMVCVGFATAWACDSQCEKVVAYHDAIATSDGYGNTYRYKKLVWQDAKDANLRAKLAWVEHCNEDCDNDPMCDGFGPAEGCSGGQARWDSYQASKTELEHAYIDMEDSYDEWGDAAAICGVIRLVMLNHCQSHGHDACDLEEEEPTR